MQRIGNVDVDYESLPYLQEAALSDVRNALDAAKGELNADSENAIRTALEVRNLIVCIVGNTTIIITSGRDFDGPSDCWKH